MAKAPLSTLMSLFNVGIADGGVPTKRDFKERAKRLIAKARVQGREEGAELLERAMAAVLARYGDGLPSANIPDLFALHDGDPFASSISLVGSTQQQARTGKTTRTFNAETVKGYLNAEYVDVRRLVLAVSSQAGFQESDYQPRVRPTSTADASPDESAADQTDVGGCRTLPLTTDFIVRLDDPLIRVLSMRALSVQLPVTWTPFSARLGNTSFWAGTYTSAAPLTWDWKLVWIPDGWYTAGKLCAALTGAVNAHVTGVTFKPTEGRKTMSIEGGATPPEKVVFVWYFNARTSPFATAAACQALFPDWTGDMAQDFCDTVKTLSTGVPATSTPPADLIPAEFMDTSLGWALGARRRKGGASWTEIPVPVLGTTDVVLDAAYSLRGTKSMYLAIDDFQSNRSQTIEVIGARRPDTATKLTARTALASGVDERLSRLRTGVITGDGSTPTTVPCLESEGYATFLATTPNAVRFSIEAELDAQYRPFEFVTPQAMPDKLARLDLDLGQTAGPDDDLVDSMPDVLTIGGSKIKSQERKYFGPVDISRFRVRLYDSLGRLVDLHGADWEFSLEIEIVYQG